MYICIYVSMYVCIYVYMYTYVYMYICIYVYSVRFKSMSRRHPRINEVDF